MSKFRLFAIAIISGIALATGGVLAGGVDAETYFKSPLKDCPTEPPAGFTLPALKERCRISFTGPIELTSLLPLPCGCSRSLTSQGPPLQSRTVCIAGGPGQIEFTRTGTWQRFYASAGDILLFRSETSGVVVCKLVTPQDPAEFAKRAAKEIFSEIDWSKF